jgi:hypothetical protein
MALLDRFLRVVSRLRYLIGGRTTQKPIQSGPGYPVW